MRRLTEGSNSGRRTDLNVAEGVIVVTPRIDLVEQGCGAHH